MRDSVCAREHKTIQNKMLIAHGHPNLCHAPREQHRQTRTTGVSKAGRTRVPVCVCVRGRTWGTIP